MPDLLNVRVYGQQLYPAPPNQPVRAGAAVASEARLVKPKAPHEIKIEPGEDGRFSLADKERKYEMLAPKTIKFAPRTDFLQSLVGPLPSMEQDVTHVIMREYTLLPCEKNLQTTLYRTASYYNQLINDGARLPKYTRWVAGLWPKEPKIVEVMAGLCQKLKPMTPYISGDCVDIMRASSSKHFSSCLNGSKTLLDIAETTPGIAVLCADDPSCGDMLMRLWIMHVKNTKTKEEGVSLGRMYGNGAGMQAVAQAIAKKYGIPVWQAGGEYQPPGSDTLEVIKGFPRQVYFDFQAWGTASGTRLA